MTQLIFIGCRTWNIKAIAQNNKIQALLSGGLVHISWLITVGIGGISMHIIINDFNWNYLPIVVCSLVGSLIGTHLGMKNKTS